LRSRGCNKERGILIQFANALTRWKIVSAILFVHIGKNTLPVIAKFLLQKFIMFYLHNFIWIVRFSSETGRRQEWNGGLAD
jgi:hypothetical protein